MKKDAMGKNVSKTTSSLKKAVSLDGNKAKDGDRASLPREGVGGKHYPGGKKG